MARRSATAPRCSTRSPCTPRATPSRSSSAAQHRGGRQGPADHPRCAAPQGDRPADGGDQLHRVEDGTVYDLSSLHGRMAIRRVVRSTCVDCASLFTKFVDWFARQGAQGRVAGARAGGQRCRAAARSKAMQKALDVPLAIGEFGGSGQDPEGSPFSRDSCSRIATGSLIVIDGRGIRAVPGPIAPNSDDTEAVLDELFAAATRRRGARTRTDRPCASQYGAPGGPQRANGVPMTAIVRASTASIQASAAVCSSPRPARDRRRRDRRRVVDLVRDGAAR